MKFGKNLKEGLEERWKRWSAYAVMYKAMKRLLPPNDDDDLDFGESENDIVFWKIYNKCLLALKEFYEEKVEMCSGKVNDFQTRLDETIRLSQYEAMNDMKKNLVIFQQEVELILEFIEINRTACRKILKKYDKRTSSIILEEKMSQLQETHGFLFGCPVISDMKQKIEAMLRVIEQHEDSHVNKEMPLYGTKQYPPTHNKLSRSVARKAKMILNKMEESPIFLSNKKRCNPLFTRQEIELGKYLGEGEFGVVHEIKAFHVKDICPICFLYQQQEQEHDRGGTTDDNYQPICKPIPTTSKEEFNFIAKKNDLIEYEDDHVEEAEELICNRGFMKEHCYRNNSPRYAIKEVKTTLKGNALADGSIDICIEAKFLSILSHPNIIKLCGISKVPGGDPRSFLVLDRLYDTIGSRILCWRKDIKEQNKGLFSKLKRGNKYKWFWEERLLAMYDIARAMRYLHKNQILYRDIKPENAGFDVRGNVKLFDFGLAKELQQKDQIGPDLYKASGRTGTRRYMSPENTLCKPYGKPTDVYSFGILFWETLALEKPFDGYGYEKHAVEVVKKGKRPHIPKQWPLFIKTLTAELWAADPSQRPHFERICDTIKGELLVGDDLNLSQRTQDLMDLSATNRELHRQQNQ